MTDHSEFVRQLRAGEFGGWVGEQAADAIEWQAKEIERLEAKLLKANNWFDIHRDFMGEKIMFSLVKFLEGGK